MGEPAWLSELRPLIVGTSDRFAQLATVDEHGHPRCRTVVVRELDADGTLRFTADAGSAKVSQIAAEPRAELCWYLGGAWRQFRLAGRLALESEAAHDRLWDAVGEATRAQFASRDDLLVYALAVERVDTLDVSVQPFARARHALDGSTWRTRADDL